MSILAERTQSRTVLPDFPRRYLQRLKRYLRSFVPLIRVAVFCLSSGAQMLSRDILRLRVAGFIAHSPPGGGRTPAPTAAAHPNVPNPGSNLLEMKNDQILSQISEF
jgi:hypothetical protein